MTDFYSIPTTLGAAKIAAAANVNQELTITHMAFGDANGLPYLPVTRVNSTTLLNERHRVAIEYLNQDSANANVYITKARIPAAIGGFEVNEIGLFDSDGDMIYLANYPRTFKPQITQGAGGELNVKIRMMTSHSAALTLVLNPLVITLTQADADDRYALKMDLDAEAIARENADLALAIYINARTQQATQLTYGVSRAASQVEVDAGDVPWEFVSPQTAKAAPWAVKAYVLFDIDGVILKSYNIESVDEISSGAHKLTFTNELSDNNYLVVGSCKPAAGTSSAVLCSKLEGEYSTLAVDIETQVNTATPFAVPCSLVSVLIF